MHNDFLEKFQRARNAGTPLFAISSFDPEATMASLQKQTLTADEPVPIINWDIIRGWRHRNEAGSAAIKTVLGDIDIDATINPVSSLQFAFGLPANSMLFMMNAQHFLDKADFMQALWNLRDVYKANGRSIVLLGPDFSLPAQLQQDVFVMDEPLPTDADLKLIVSEIAVSNGADVSDELEAQAVDALRGLAAFPAEQSVAMNLSKSKGINISGLWERKNKLISSTPGLRIYDGKESFKDIGGCDQIKRFMSGVIKGNDAPNVIVFIDEGEKMFAGATNAAGDSSGTAQDALGTTLTKMEDNEWDGAIFIGPPGAAKSAIAKATGNEAGVPTIVFDFGGMKGSLVGKSEAQVRNAYKVVEAVGGGRAFFIMTCNKIVDLPPELRRRFTSGIFFFDLPTAEERAVIWPIYAKKYGIDISNLGQWFDDDGWTGAEIRNCCRLAYRQSITIGEAAKFIVPVSKAAGAAIKQLRKQASGAYLSANEPGIYSWSDPDDPLTASTIEPGAGTRRLKLGE